MGYRMFQPSAQPENTFGGFVTGMPPQCFAFHVNILFIFMVGKLRLLKAWESVCACVHYIEYAMMIVLCDLYLRLSAEHGHPGDVDAQVHAEGWNTPIRGLRFVYSTPVRVFR